MKIFASCIRKTNKSLIYLNENLNDKVITNKWEAKHANARHDEIQEKEQQKKNIVRENHTSDSSDYMFGSSLDIKILTIILQLWGTFLFTTRFLYGFLFQQILFLW